MYILCFWQNDNKNNKQQKNKNSTQKKEKKERKGKQTRRNWNGLLNVILKAETLLNDESQRIPTTNLLVKNQHGVQQQIQENLNPVYSL